MTTTTLGTDVHTGPLGAPGYRVTYLDEGPSGPPPVKPTLQMAGCTNWATC